MRKGLLIATFVVGCIAILWHTGASIASLGIANRTPVLLPLLMLLLSTVITAGYGLILYGRELGGKVAAPAIFGAMLLSGVWLIVSIFQRSGYGMVSFLLILVVAGLHLAASKLSSTNEDPGALPPPPPIPKDPSH